MTTIAYKDGIMVADSRAWSGGWSPIGEKVKIRRLDDGTLIAAACSIVGGSELAMDWYADGHPPLATLQDQFTLLVVAPNGSARLADDKPMLTSPIRAPYYAIGSGRQYAIALLEYGCTAEQAIRIACRLDIGSDHPLYWASHGEGPIRI